MKLSMAKGVFIFKRVDSYCASKDTFKWPSMKMIQNKAQNYLFTYLLIYFSFRKLSKSLQLFRTNLKKV